MKYDKEVFYFGALAISLFLLAIFFLVLQNTSLLFVFEKKEPILLDLTTLEMEEDTMTALASNALLAEKSTEKKRDLAEEIKQKIETIDRKVKKDYSLKHPNSMFSVTDSSQNKPLEKEEEKLENQEQNSFSKKYTGASAYESWMENRWMVKEYLPIYQCKNGGKIIVFVEINPMGEIENFKIDTQNSLSDLCLQKAAIESIQKTLFNIDFNAPKRQKGKIIFYFSAQK